MKFLISVIELIEKIRNYALICSTPCMFKHSVQTPGKLLLGKVTLFSIFMPNELLIFET